MTAGSFFFQMDIPDVQTQSVYTPDDFSSIITSVLAAVTGILSIYEADWMWFDEDFYIHLCYSFLMACAFSLPVGYLTEKMQSVKKYIVQSLSALISATGAYLLFYFEEYESYQLMYYLGILFAVVAFAIFLFSPKENSKAYYSNILKNFGKVI